MLNGTLAQLVEHRAFNPLVEGSSPSRPTGETGEEKMTYRELLEELEELDDSRLDDDAAIHLTETDEFYPVHSVCVAVENECDVLDQGHLILAVVA